LFRRVYRYVRATRSRPQKPQGQHNHNTMRQYTPQHNGTHRGQKSTAQLTDRNTMRVSEMNGTQHNPQGWVCAGWGRWWRLVGMGVDLMCTCLFVLSSFLYIVLLRSERHQHRVHVTEQFGSARLIVLQLLICLGRPSKLSEYFFRSFGLGLTPLNLSEAIMLPTYSSYKNPFLKAPSEKL